MSTKFCDNLKIARALSGLTQQQVADLTGIARSTYTLYESGKREPTVEGIKKIARGMMKRRKPGLTSTDRRKPGNRPQRTELP